MGMSQTTANYLKHHFLIAMPHMADPRFVNTLIYLCDHNEDGAMGLVINQPSDLQLADIPVSRSITAARCKPSAALCCTRAPNSGKPAWIWVRCS